MELGARNKTVFKALISAFLLYHLATIFILPNSSSLVGRKVGWLFIPYANRLGLNTTWQFFSPGPAPMYHLEYEVEKTNGKVDETIYEYPPKKTGWFSDGYNRRLYGMRFFSMGDEKLRSYLVPYLCRQHPDAQAIVLQSIVQRVPDIERAGTFKNYEDAQEKQQLPRQAYDCGREPTVQDAEEAADENLVDAENAEAEGTMNGGVAPAPDSSAGTSQGGKQ